jgi:hypothetical protein
MSLYFGNATSDRVNVASGSTLDNINKGTLLVCCNPNATDQSGRFWSKGASVSAGGTGHYCAQTPAASGRFELAIARATSALVASCNVSAASTFAAGKFSFVGFTWDSAGAASDQRIYHADFATAFAEVSSYFSQALGSGTVGDDSADDGYLGNFVTANAGFPGHIAPIALWKNVILTTTQMDAWKCDPEMLIGGESGSWWLGDNGTGTVEDHSGNGNHGTVTGATYSADPPIRRLRSLLLSPAVQRAANW